MVYTPTIIGSGIAAYTFLQRTQDQQTRAFAASPQVAREITHFEDKIQSIETVDELLEDRTLLRVALGAFGLQDDLNNNGFIRKVLESDLNDSDSFVNRLTDKKYLNLARTFNFGGDARLLGSDSTDDARAAIRNLSNPENLFDPAFSSLLTSALEAFGIEGDKDRTVFLQRVASSDLDDPTSLANRLDNKAYVAFAQAYQGIEPKIDANFLRAVSEDVGNRLQALNTSEDLVNDRELLRATLDVFDLGDMAGNTYFLQSVLDSDLSDPNSFANQQDDPRFAELAEVFGFQARISEQESIYGFVDAFEDKLNTFETVDDLLEDDAALTAALTVFDLQDDDFLANEDNLRDVLNSDLSDDASVANAREDGRYAALAGLFSFFDIGEGEDVAEAQSRLNDMVDAVNGRSTQIKTGEELVADASFIVATMSFFDLPSGAEGGQRFNRIATSDAQNPTSLLNLLNDPQYNAFYKAMDFQEADASRSYPTGFTQQVTEAYVTRQFEVSVGEVDETMRIAIALERELTDVVNSSRSNDAQWFSLMSSPPLRSVFESALSLPSSFGSLDLDRQLVDFKDRSERILGSSVLADFLAPEKLDALRDGYLGINGNTTQQASSRTQIASILLGSALGG